MKLPKYTGITLVYTCRNDKEITAVQKSFITNAKSFDELKKKIKRIVENPDSDIKDHNCEYIGINDVFEINGSLKHEPILGRMILWSYKNIKSAEKLLKAKSEFWIKLKHMKQHKQFVSEIVFFLSSPKRYQDRRTIICNVLVEAENKADVFKKTINIGKSIKFKESLFNAIAQHEPNLTNELIFIGISNIKFVYDKVAIGKCFEALSKKQSSVASTMKLVFPLKKFRDYKF